MADNNKLNDLIRFASKKIGADPENLKKSLETGQVDQVLNGLNPQQSQNIRDILNNPEKLQAILQSPQAKEIMNKFQNPNKK